MHLWAKIELMFAGEQMENCGLLPSVKGLRFWNLFSAALSAVSVIEESRVCNRTFLMTDL